jgi:hypothetical protein
VVNFGKGDFKQEWPGIKKYSSHLVGFFIIYYRLKADCPFYSGPKLKNELAGFFDSAF